MNDIEKAIEVLKMENELMQFDPMTGEIEPIELQNQDNQDLYNANLMAISALEKELNGGWIPVSERFPKENDIYLVTFEEQEKRYVERLYFSTMNGWYMPLVWQDEGKIEKIIAWQSLPEPYKEVENE